MTHFQVFKTWIVIILWLSTTCSSLSGQILDELIDYSVIPSCVSPDPNKPTDQDKFYFQLNISSMIPSESDFEILIDGASVLQFHVDSSEIPLNRSVGPFNHSGIGGTFHEYILRSLETEASDTLYVPEVVCGRSTNNGLNRAGYYCERTNYGAIAQVSPELLDAPQLPDKTYVYVIMDRSNLLVVDRNFSGHFDNLDDLTDYEIHAFSVSFETQADFINNIVIGEPLDQNDLDICYALCGIFEVRVDCSSFDLSLEKNVIGGFVYAIGDTVLFDIIVHNDGRVKAYDIVVRDIKPDALEFLPNLNPFWNNDFTSKPIDSIAAGGSVSIPVYMRVSRLSTQIEVTNVADIAFATDVRSKEIAAFDVDSTPGNEENEDDRDGVVIIILENLCDATFEISAGNEPVCKGQPLVLMAEIMMATFPIQRFQWRNEFGKIISRDSIYTVANHGSGDYGEYSLTIVDANGCSGTEYVTIEPIDNDNRFSCVTDLYIGVNKDCEIYLRPFMFTTRDVSAINDYTLLIRDENGNTVDPSDLSEYPPGTILEGIIINPCTLETMCWSNLHVEHKATPEFDLYGDEKLETICHEIFSEDPTIIIENFNLLNDDPILSAMAFQNHLNETVCLQFWEVDVLDELHKPSTPCDSYSVTRTYFIYDQERRLPIDVATIIINPIIPDSIIIPDDIDNISCSFGISPEDLNSFPALAHNGAEIPLNKIYNNRNATFCNIGITYNDNYLSQACVLGTSKIIRKWSALDWCSNSFVEDVQYLFVVDKEGPNLEFSNQNVQVSTAPFACSAIVVVDQYFSFSDECDPSPTFSINQIQQSKLELALGDHLVSVEVKDRCGNVTVGALNIHVGESTPPIPIIKENITISLPDDTIGIDSYISVDALDAGSHDYDCGPVELKIARASEIILIESEGGQVATNYNLRNCMDDLSILDGNSNEIITKDELFRNKIFFCCQDIGAHIQIIVRVIDGSGNQSEVMVTVFVDAKKEWTVCDDGDVCTTDDKQYGDCPCSGAPIISDFDQDNIIDCNDDVITVCLNGIQEDITFPELSGYVSNGATGGNCNSNEVEATIAGAVYTAHGDMIQDVSVTINEERSDFTSSEGYYRFDHNDMYQRYELYPERDGDDINGVSTLDLVYLQEYILGQKEFDDPYLMIAADINNDGRISALDLVDLRRLLLGLASEFEQNKSWRFVIADFEFDDIKDPFNYKEINVISNLNRNMMEEDWIGIKIGDLSNNAVTNEFKAENRSSKELILNIYNRKVKAGEEVKIPIGVDNEKDIRGMQLGLSFDGMDFNGITSGDLTVKPGQFSYHNRSYDQFAFVWHSTSVTRLRNELFYINATILKDGDLKDMIDIGRSIPNAQVYFENYSEGEIQLQFLDGYEEQEISLIELYQNQPNPFNGETIIQFYIPRKGRVDMLFYDEKGSLIFEMTNEYHQGINALRLTNSDLNLFRGLIYYQMKYENQSLSRKMIIAQ